MVSKKDELLRVIKEFHDRGQLPYISQLFWSTSLAPSTISRHLKNLEREGVIKFIERNGRKYVLLLNYEKSLRKLHSSQTFS